MILKIRFFIDTNWSCLKSFFSRPLFSEFQGRFKKKSSIIQKTGMRSNL